MSFDEDIQIERARENLVVKDNRLIQNIDRRRYTLSTLEQKILCFFISLIKPPTDITDKPQYTYTFDIVKFCKVCGIDYNNGKNYANIKIAIQQLSDKSFWIKDNGVSTLLRWFDSATIQEKSGKISIRFSPEIIPYLFNLQERFTQYELYQTLALRSSYSIALYELLKSHAFKKEITIDIQNLRRYLAIDDNKYNDFTDFRKRVIDHAVKEINTYTDLSVEWNGNKQGKSYVSITFDISLKEQWDMYEAYRRTIAEINGVNHSPGQINLFE